MSRFASIALKKKKKNQFAKELAKILDYVKKLQEVETKGIQPAAHVSGLYNIWREDREANHRKKAVVEKLLKEAPNRQDNFLRVKTIF